VCFYSSLPTSTATTTPQRMLQLKLILASLFLNRWMYTAMLPELQQFQNAATINDTTNDTTTSCVIQCTRPYTGQLVFINPRQSLVSFTSVLLASPTSSQSACTIDRIHPDLVYRKTNNTHTGICHILCRYSLASWV
jgi:hypothetical protein